MLMSDPASLIWSTTSELLKQVLEWYLLIRVAYMELVFLTPIIYNHHSKIWKLKKGMNYCYRTGHDSSRPSGASPAQKIEKWNELNFTVNLGTDAMSIKSAEQQKLDK